ncbi:hypothetical protein AYO37_01000 [Opitutia bacterium SCGC AG-212-L18]|nr:hypothetical protein AYO37_01000 [Opitutae bacterium SCGC AG-212-L18]
MSTNNTIRGSSLGPRITQEKSSECESKNNERTVEYEHGTDSRSTVTQRVQEYSYSETHSYATGEVDAFSITTRSIETYGENEHSNHSNLVIMSVIGLLGVIGLGYVYSKNP